MCTRRARPTAAARLGVCLDTWHSRHFVHHGGSLMFARAATIAGLAIVCLASTSLADKHLGERISDSRAVLQELLSSPDKTVPQSLLKNAKCVAVIPHL